MLRFSTKCENLKTEQRSAKTTLLREEKNVLRLDTNNCSEMLDFANAIPPVN